MHTDDETHDPLSAMHAAAPSWRPHPLSLPDPPMPWRQRLAILLFVLSGHALVAWWLDLGSRVRLTDGEREVTTLVFIAPEPEPAATVEPEAAPSPDPEPVEPGPRPARPPVVPRDAQPRVETPPVETPDVPSTTSPVERTPPAPAATTPPTDTAPRRPRGPSPMQAIEPTPRATRDDDGALSLYRADGSVDLPDDVVARLEDVDADDRDFSFRLAGVAESESFLERRQAIVYEPTRFDEYWRPEKDLLTSLLEEAVSRSTKSVEIPIPGSPGSKIVCTVAVLALGGGCRIRHNNEGYIVGLDDPDTLSEEEDKQCKAWWDQIASATDQDAWRHTRALYESSCRKPLERRPAQPR